MRHAPVIVAGVPMSLKEACEVTGVRYATAIQRIYRGMLPQEAATKPMSKKWRRPSVAKPPRTHMCSIIIKLPPSLKSVVDQRAKRSGVSRSAFIRDAITSYLSD